MLKNQNHLNSAQVRFDDVGVYYFSKPAWLGGEPCKALEHLNLTIETQSLAVVGPSGAGKSTLIELLFGLRKPTYGEIYICGRPLSKCSAKQRKEYSYHIQLIPQESQSSLNPYYAVRDILIEPLLNIGCKQNHNEKIEKVLQDVGLNKSLLGYRSQTLSVGQAQRVAIARALILEPCVLVADEPTSNLDPVSRQRIIDLLQQIKKNQQMRLILVTHDLDAAQALCDEILVLDKGQVVEHGKAKDLVENPIHPITKALLKAQYGNNNFMQTTQKALYAS